VREAGELACEVCATRRMQFTSFYIIGTGNKNEKRNNYGWGCNYLLYDCIRDVYI
jgi:hypothetical protein